MPGMIGAFLNALGILLGGGYGLVGRKPLSARTQNYFKLTLGAALLLLGGRLVVLNLTGSFGSAVKQLLFGLLSVVLGFWIGKLLSIQKFSNRLGRRAANLLAAAQTKPPGKPADGILVGTLLFSAAPLGVLGAVLDGVNGFFYLLLLKGIMDGLATATFVKIFRWPAMLAAVPIFLFLDGLAMVVHLWVAPWLETHALGGALSVTAGLLACVISLVVFEVRRVELNSYLPALVVAPILKLWVG